MNIIEFGDCRDTMRRWTAEGVRAQMCVTSPPYYGLRDYGHPGQLGLEATPEEYIANMVEVFRCVRDVLADDGTLWLNIGDSYAGSGRGGHVSNSSTPEGSIEHEQEARRARGSQLAPGFHTQAANAGQIGRAWVPPPPGLKTKDLIGIPWMLALALRADGWYLRQDIIWHKPNPMPESVRDRCTKSHEYLFLLSKSERYVFDADAIAEQLADSSVARVTQPGWEQQKGSDRVPGKTNGLMKAVTRRNSFARAGKNATSEHGQKPQFREDREPVAYEGRRNKRSVWTVATVSYKGAHFATFPPALIEPCILAGSRPGDIVLDPFMGSGTTAQVSMRLGRQYIGCELNPAYQALQAERTQQPALELT